MKTFSTEKARHLILRVDEGELLPAALTTELRDQAVTCGWLRGSGVLTDVELCAYEGGALAPPRRIDGPVHVVALEGSIGLSAGDVSFGMRAVIARETDRGLETLAGELVAARAVALEVLVTAFDEHALPRALDPAAKVWLLGEPSRAAAPTAHEAPLRSPDPSPAPARHPAEWSAAIAASTAAPQDNPRPPAPPPASSAGAPLGAPLPPRPVRPPPSEHPEGSLPEVGDLVDHFAFGRCDVLKSDGERLHLRMHKDGRVKEIALDRLKVTPIEEEDGKRAFRLARRM